MQEHWSELPFPSAGHLPDPGIEPTSPALQADSLLSEPPGMCIYTPPIQVVEPRDVKLLVQSQTVNSILLFIQ